MLSYIYVREEQIDRIYDNYVCVNDVMQQN